MPQPILEAKNIEKHFSGGANHPAILRGISLKLLAGEALGVLGPNHSGKSLLLSILAGKIKPSAGQVTGPQLGLAADEAADEAARGALGPIGLMPEQSIFPAVFTVKDIFSYHQQYCARCGDGTGEPGAGFLQGTAIEGLWQKRITALDTVQQRWLSFYLAAYGQPKALLLDEPFRFFDEAATARLGEEVAALKAKGVAIAIASHNLAKLRELCEEMVILHEGKIIHRAKKILPDQQTYFCLHISGANQQTFDDMASELPPWQALFFEGFLARVFYSSYADCYRMMQAVIAKGLVIVKFDTEAKPHLDSRHITPHLRAGGNS